MHFSRMIQAGAFVATLACCAAALPARAQDVLRVVDARGHQVGILVQGIETTAAMPDIDMFEAVDHMMAQDMALMAAIDRTLTSRPDGVLRAVPAVGHDLPKQSMFLAAFRGGQRRWTHRLYADDHDYIKRSGGTNRSCVTHRKQVLCDAPRVDGN